MYVYLEAYGMYLRLKDHDFVEVVPSHPDISVFQGFTRVFESFLNEINLVLELDHKLIILLGLTRLQTGCSVLLDFQYLLVLLDLGPGEVFDQINPILVPRIKLQLPGVTSVV